MKKTKITFALYLNEHTTSLNLCLDQLNKIDQDTNEIIIYIDSDSVDLNVAIQQFLQSNKFKNLIVVKNSTPLNKAYCFNDAIKMANSEYILFMNFNSIIDDNFSNEVKDVLNNNYDVISFEATNPDIFYKLKGHTFTKITSELITSNATKTLYNKLFNLEYLRHNKIFFKKDKWYPEYFLFQIFLTFKFWKNLESKELITFRKNNDISFNLYDLLFQIEYIDKLAKNYQIGNEFRDEFEFWYAFIVKYKFLSKIFDKYKANDSKNIQYLKNKEIQKIAVQNAKKIVKEFCPNLSKNPHYKIFKKILDTYSK